MKLTRWLWIGGVGIFVVSTICHIPAGVVIKPLVKSQSGIQLSGVQGSLWRGSVNQVTLSVRGQTLDLGELEWQLSSWRLLLGKLSAAVRFGRNSSMAIRGDGQLGVSFSGAFVDRLVMSAPAPLLNRAIRLPIPVNVNGALELSVNDYQQGSQICQTGHGQIVWHDADVQWMSDALKLNQITSDWQCHDDAFTLNAKQQSNMVDSHWSVSLTPRDYQFDGSFKPQPTFPARLKSQLSWLPSPDAQGRYHIKDSGHW